MELVLHLPSELEAELATEAAQLGLPLSEYALRLIAAGRSAGPALRTGTELLGYWQSVGLVGTRPEMADSQAHARGLREQANYTEERDALFGQLTLDDIVAAIEEKRARQPSNPAPNSAENGPAD
jgi:hypothetical protein